MANATRMTTEEQVFVLSTMTTRDHAGRHFTERYADETLATLESLGLIEIHRPIHEPTGIPYSQEYSSVEVTQDGRDMVEANPEHWDTAATA